MLCSHGLPKVNNALAAFKRLKENAAEGKRPYREDTIMYKDTLDGLNIVVRHEDIAWKFRSNSVCGGEAGEYRQSTEKLRS